MPDWILQFQMLRGILWAIVTVPIIISFKGSVWELRVSIALTFVIFVAGLLLIPNEVMIPQIFIAHFIELAIGHCIVFGLIMTELFRKHHRFPLLWRVLSRIP